MWLVKALQPLRIVELDTHYGYSSFAMCQAVKEAGLPIKCYAVDTWSGDEHIGVYTEDGLESVFNESLLRKTFEEARADIEDGSVDLRHVDGGLFYEDVKHDFERRLPKLSERAVALFHDTVEKGRGFGDRYWVEFSGRYPSFNFTHCHGLDVPVHGPEVPPEIRELVALSRTKGGPGMVESFFRRSELDYG